MGDQRQAPGPLPRGTDPIPIV